MMPPGCPLREGGIDRDPTKVEGLEYLSFIGRKEGGGGESFFQCKVCGLSFSMQEEMGSYFVEYHWPQDCLRLELRPDEPPKDVEPGASA